MKASGIYQIQSKIKPERVYIGSAVDIRDRWRCHLKDLKYNKHASKKLQRHFNKYGADDLCFSILLECEKDVLLRNEQLYLDSFEAYFNTCKIAGSQLGIKRSKETLEKMSKASRGNKIWLGKKHSEESKRKIGIKSKGRIPWNKGKTGIYSAETRRKISESLKGKTLSEITKLKLSNSLKGRIFSDESKKKIGKSHMKPILQFDKSLNFIKEWDSSISAIKELSLSQSNLSMCLNGRRRKTGGFIWKIKSA